MDNNLYNVEKNLRSIAKRYENVKYSVGLTVLFLMKGTSAFSDGNIIQEAEKQKDILTDVKKDKIEVKETKKVVKATQKLKASWTNMQFGANDLYSNFLVAPKTKVEKTSIVKNEKTVLVASADNNISLPMLAKLTSDIEETTTPTVEEINTSKGNLRNSIGNLQEKINNARKENAKEIQGLKLELVQLMEQGDQVVKSPWSSWQFGANYFYDNWGSAYKGRGDKKGTEALARDNSKTLNRFLESSASSTAYGSTNLNLVKEPSVEITISAGVRPKNINKQAPSYRPSAPAVALPVFEPKLLSAPRKPSAPVEVTPTTFNPPALNFVGTGFPQGPGIGMPKNTIIIQNYEKYSTPNGVFKIESGESGSTWTGTVRAKSTTTPALSGDLTDGNSNPFKLFTFINELRDHDSVISGEYEMTDLGGGNRTKIFLSYNPAAVGGDYGGAYAPNDRTVTFDGKLTLHGITAPNNTNVLVGVEHQLWARHSRTHLQSSSNFLNKGDIILASGNNIVGIMIDVEQMQDADRKSHTTKNDGRIIINSQNSIGIDFGQYSFQEVTKVDVTLGNIIVNGKNNYGARMKKHFYTTSIKSLLCSLYDVL